MNKFNMLVEGLLNQIARAAQNVNDGSVYQDLIPSNNKDNNKYNDKVKDKDKDKKRNENNIKNKNEEKIIFDSDMNWNDFVQKLKTYKTFSINVDGKNIYPVYDEASLTNGNHQPQTTKTFIVDLKNPKYQYQVEYSVITAINKKTGKNNDQIVKKVNSPNTSKTNLLIGYNTFYPELIIYKMDDQNL